MKLEFHNMTRADRNDLKNVIEAAKWEHVIADKHATAQFFSDFLDSIKKQEKQNENKKVKNNLRLVE